MATQTVLDYLTHGDATTTLQDVEDTLNNSPEFRARIERKYGVPAEIILNFVREQLIEQESSPYA